MTLADREAEAAMRRLIEARFPEDAIIGENSACAKGPAAAPGCSTRSTAPRAFITGRPIFGTLIALVVEGWPVLGVIDQPILGERWLGSVGQPTTLNGQTGRTRACRKLQDALLATTGPQHLFDEGDRLHAFGR